MNQIPGFSSSSKLLNQAYRLAVGCLAANTVTIDTGILTKPLPVFAAGMDYDTPWTRDASINVWNAGGLLDPQTAKNTLSAVLEPVPGQEDKLHIGDQYWDKIIWSMGSWRLYEITSDLEYLKLSYRALSETMKELEAGEQDEQDGFFRGPAVYGDGISAYPLKYRHDHLKYSGIANWASEKPELAYPKGVGIPMKALSTNCVYAESYRILSLMADLLDTPEAAASYLKKSKQLKAAIHDSFWNEKNGSFDYLYQECDAQEGLGLAFAILFDIADEKQISSILKHVVVSPYGIACVYPSFEPYAQEGYGRHCGTIWPHVQGFWAAAMRKCGQQKRFDHELFALAGNAVRDRQFAEIYHPDTGEIYGGIQEGGGSYHLWASCQYQTWSATAFLNMIFNGILGFSYKEALELDPRLPDGIDFVSLNHLTYRGECYDIRITREGSGCKTEISRQGEKEL